MLLIINKSLECQVSKEPRASLTQYLWFLPALLTLLPTVNLSLQVPGFHFPSAASDPIQTQAFWMCALLLSWLTPGLLPPSPLSCPLSSFSLPSSDSLPPFFSWPSSFCWSCPVWTLLDAPGCSLCHIDGKPPQPNLGTVKSSFFSSNGEYSVYRRNVRQMWGEDVERMGVKE